jgi:surface antigen
MPQLQLSITTGVLLAALVATATVSFAGNLGFLNDTAIAALTDEDRKMQLDAAVSALESADGKATREWTNPATHSFGRTESSGNYKSEDGLHCRKMKLFVQAKGIESQFAFPVCKGADGEWFIATGKTLTKT